MGRSAAVEADPGVAYERMLEEADRALAEAREGAECGGCRFWIPFRHSDALGDHDGLCLYEAMHGEPDAESRDRTDAACDGYELEGGAL